MLKKICLILLFILSFSYAKTYTLHMASTKYLDQAKLYYKDIKFNCPSFCNVIIRTPLKKNYSILIINIPTIKKSKKIQKLFHLKNKYTDSYIKKFRIKPNYKIVNLLGIRINDKETQDLYKQNVENSNKYITASVMYNSKQYKKAYKLFYKLFLNNNYNININYFLAKSAFNIKKYDQAIVALQRVLLLKPSFNQARYDLARVLYILKQKKEARIEFIKLLNSDIKEQTRVSIKKYLDILNKKKDKVSIYANLSIGINRSSNVNNGIKSSTFNLPGLNNILVESEKAKKDTSYFQMANIDFIYYLKNNSLKISNYLFAYNINYSKEKDENTTIISYKPSLLYQKNEKLYKLVFSTDKIYKKDNNGFYSLSISPQYIYNNFKSYIKYQRVIYIKKENKEKDFKKIQFSSSLNLLKNFEYYIDLYKNTKIKDLRTDIDKYTIVNGINIFYDITSSNRINFNYKYYYSKYKYINIAFNTKRKDKKHSLQLLYRYKINKSTLLNFSTSYTKNNSNQIAYKYNDKQIELNYIKAFKW